MSAKITEIIGPQGYEVIRDQIGIVLTEELAHQQAMTYDEDLNAKIFVERFIPVSHEECPVINISLSSGEFDGYTQVNHHATYVFDIDVYTSRATSIDGRGDVLSVKESHRLIGICKAILLNPIYYMLGFEPGFIENKPFFSDLKIGVPNLAESESVVLSRAKLIVRCVEDSIVINNAIQLCQSNTSVKIGLTDKGYAYSINECLNLALFDDDSEILFDDENNVKFD